MSFRGSTVTPETFHDSLILTGPTASGKTRLGLDLAERLGAEIVSMDSMALYRGLDVAAAKPTAAERGRVRHHLIDVLDPWQSASVAWWLEQAARCCADIRGRGRRILFVGGTPLYLKALLCGLFDGPGADEEVRRRLEDEALSVGRVALHQRLAAVDPKAAARLHPNDLRRVVRALEVWETTGRPISAWQCQWEAGSRNRQNAGASPARVLANAATEEAKRCLCLDRPREELYARIDARVRAMVAEGLVEEIAALRRLSLSVSRQAAQAVGYEEISAHLEGRLDLAEAIRLIQTRSRHFARRQLTWFRQLPGCRFVEEELTFALWGLTMNQGNNNSQEGASNPSPPVI